jgi:uncharacterized protein YndB with AHSA1/START domain
MTDSTVTPVSVSRRIQAPAAELFAVLADPARHPGIDGSGMLRRPGDLATIGAVGDVFTMSMHNAEMGDYEIANHVVEYEQDRRIGWEPSLTAASRPEDQDGIGHRAHHRWSFELTPVAPDVTVVTETYDCTKSPQWLRTAVKGGQRWVASMTTTLEKLDQQCAAR